MHTCRANILAVTGGLQIQDQQQTNKQNQISKYPQKYTWVFNVDSSPNSHIELPRLALSGEGSLWEETQVK